MNLRIERGVLHVRNGFTHYPQARETLRFFRGDLDLPPRIIVLDGSGSVSFDVLAWLSEQKTSLVQLDWRGGVVAVLGGSGYGGDAEKIAWQKATRDDPARRLLFSIGVVRRKIEGSITTLQTIFPEASSKERGLAALRRECDLFDGPPTPRRFDVARGRGAGG